MKTTNMTILVRVMALTISAIATTGVIGGSLSLAEHYAQDGLGNHAKSGAQAYRTERTQGGDWKARPSTSYPRLLSGTTNQSLTMTRE